MKTSGLKDTPDILATNFPREIHIDFEKKHDHPKLCNPAKQGRKTNRKDSTQHSPRKLGMGNFEERWNAKRMVSGEALCGFVLITYLRVTF